MAAATVLAGGGGYAAYHTWQVEERKRAREEAAGKTAGLALGSVDDLTAGGATPPTAVLDTHRDASGLTRRLPKMSLSTHTPPGTRRSSESR